MDKLPFQTSHPVVRVVGTIGVAIVGLMVVGILLTFAAGLGILGLVVYVSLSHRWKGEGYQVRANNINTTWYPAGWPFRA